MNIRRTTSIATITLALSLSIAACGTGDEEPTSTGSDTTTSETPEEEQAQEPSAEPSEPAADAAVFGAGCKLVPKSGPGSFDGMVTDPVATAASNNPLLKTLVAAVTEADLVETLNSAPEITVFAPAEPAFAKIPKKDLNALLADKKALTTVLTNHVVEGKIAPEDLAGGTFTSLAGNEIKVAGSEPNFKVSDEKANILCGNVPTANATVYVIDSVLVP